VLINTRLKVVSKSAEIFLERSQGRNFSCRVAAGDSFADTVGETLLNIGKAIKTNQSGTTASSNAAVFRQSETVNHKFYFLNKSIKCFL